MHRTEKRTLTRARLIEAALNVFAFEGYEHATVDDIARAAGLSKGAFYFNFTTKEEILLELLRMWSDERAALLRTAYDAAEAPAERLPAMLAALLSYGGGTNWPPLVLEFWSQGIRAGEVHRRLKRAYSDLKRLLASAVADVLGDDAALAGEAARAILAMHDGAVTEIALGRAGAAGIPSATLAAAVVGALGERSASAAERFQAAAG